MNTPSQSKNPPDTASTVSGDIYQQALLNEGFQPSLQLVERVRQLHLATLTPGLVMRAFAAHRQAKLHQQQDTNKSAPAASARS